MKISYKILIPVCQLFIVFGSAKYQTCSAQQYYTGKIVYNDPEKYYPKFSVNLGVYSANLGSGKASGTSVLDFDNYILYQTTRQTGIDLRIKKSIVGIPLLENDMSQPLGSYMIQPGFIRLGKPKPIFKTRPVTISYSETYNRSTKVYVNIPNVKTIIYRGVRAGALAIGAPYKFDLDKYKDRLYWDPTFAANNPPASAFKQLSYLNTLTFYLGYHVRKLTNLKIAVDGVGDRHFSNIVNLYFDVMYQPMQVFSADGKLLDYKTPSQFNDMMHEQAPAGALGARIGMMTHMAVPKSMSGRGKQYANLELGYLPYRGIYFMFTMGFNLYTKLFDYKEEEK